MPVMTRGSGRESPASSSSGNGLPVVPRRIAAPPTRASLWAGLFDLRDNLLGRALEDLRALAV